MSRADLDAIDPSVAPLMQSVGRAVLGAAALEKVLLVDIAQRHAGREGFSRRVAEQIADLERRPAGVLLRTLKTVGIEPLLAARLEDVIRRRNHLVHHFMQDVDVVIALTTGDVDEVVGRVDAIAADCQMLINDIAPLAFAGAEGAIGASLPELVRAVGTMDLDALDDQAMAEQLRQLLAMGQAIDVEELESLLRPPAE